MTYRHVLEPLRQLTAVSPSGVEVVFRKFSESDRELSWYQGNLTEQESITFWSAKLKAERPGVDKWNEAIALLTKHGWVVAERPCGAGEGR